MWRWRDSCGTLFHRDWIISFVFMSLIPPYFVVLLWLLLLMQCCDKCPRVYHVECLGLHAPPRGEWYCPKCVSDQRRFDCLWFLKEMKTFKTEICCVLLILSFLVSEQQLFAQRTKPKLYHKLNKVKKVRTKAKTTVTAKRRVAAVRVTMKKLSRRMKKVMSTRVQRMMRNKKSWLIQQDQLV